MQTVTAWDLLIESEIILTRLQALKVQRPQWEVRAERRMTRQLATLFAEIGEQAVRELQRMGRLPSDDQSRQMISRLLRDSVAPYAEIVQGGAIDAAQHGANRIVTELQRQGAGIQFTEISEQTKQLIRTHVFEASETTLDRLTGNVMDNLTQSYEDGLGIDDAARQLDDVFDGLEKFESKRIARTEINSAQQKASHATIQELGIGYEQWIAADDDRTRETHEELNGVIVPTGEPFPNGLQHPGDFGPGIIEEAINCRCRLVPVIPPRGAVPPPGRDWWYESDWVQAS